MLALGRPQYFHKRALEDWISQGRIRSEGDICLPSPSKLWAENKVRGVSLIFLLHLRDAMVFGSQIYPPRMEKLTSTAGLESNRLSLRRRRVSKSCHHTIFSARFNVTIYQFVAAHVGLVFG